MNYNYIDYKGLLSNLYDFYISAKEGNFTKAAINCFRSQSSLSRNVKILEEQLNIKLVITNNKGFELTTDGQKLYKELDVLFNSLNIENVNSKGELTGKLVIGTTRNIADYKLEKYITQFSKLYPKVNIKIVTDSASNLNEYLVKHSIDVLIDYLPHINSSEKYDFEIKLFDKFTTCFACSKKFYSLYKEEIKKLENLKKFNLVIPGSSRRRQFLNEILQIHNLDLSPKVEMPDSKLMIDFVKANDYIGYFVEDEIIGSDLIKIDLIEEMPINPIGIIYPKNMLNNVSKKFIELVIK